jgi:hypothetical protein
MTTPGDTSGRGKPDDRHDHGDLLPAGGLEQPPLPRLPDVRGLGAEHLGQRRAALDGDQQAVDEAG